MSFKKRLLRILPGDLRKFIVRRSTKVDFENPPKGVIFKRISNNYERIWSFLYDVYLRIRYTEPNNLKMRIIPQHNNPGSTAFIAECIKDNKIIGTISVFCADKGNLPMEQGFKKEVQDLKEQNRKTCEIGALAIHPEYRNRNQDTVDILFIFNKLCILYAMNVLGANDALITAHPKNEYIYTDLFFFERIGYLKSFSYVNDQPAVLLRLNLNTLEARAEVTYKNFEKSKNIYNFVFEKSW